MIYIMIGVSEKGARTKAERRDRLERARSEKPVPTFSKRALL
jgi:hypothetical protein